MIHEHCVCHRPLSFLARRWMALSKFAYRRATRACDIMPTGVPGNRDPSAPCTSYDPRKREGFVCPGDGHYLCRECCHYEPERTL